MSDILSIQTPFFTGEGVYKRRSESEEGYENVSPRPFIFNDPRCRLQQRKKKMVWFYTAPERESADIQEEKVKEYRFQDKNARWVGRTMGQVVIRFRRG